MDGCCCDECFVLVKVPVTINPVTEQINQIETEIIDTDCTSPSPSFAFISLIFT